MNLYQIDRAILDLINEDTGEVTDFEQLEKLQMEKERKIENLALYVKNQAANIEAIRHEEQNLGMRRRGLENAMERAKNYLSHILAGEKFETPKCKVTFRTSETVDVEDEEELINYLTLNHFYDAVKYTSVPIKSEVKKLIAAGEDVPGVVINQKRNVGVK